MSMINSMQSTASTLSTYRTTLQTLVQQTDPLENGECAYCGSDTGAAPDGPYHEDDCAYQQAVSLLATDPTMGGLSDYG